MKYANRLTETELRELYLMFTDSGASIEGLNITKDDRFVTLEGYVRIPEYDKEILAEDPDATLVIDDDYKIDDFNVIVYHHSGNCTLNYRRWMYQRFGNKYARDFLLWDDKVNPIDYETEA